jgi:hypothetical protein
MDTQKMIPIHIFQSGYLTLSGIKGSVATKVLRLKNPNNEIRNAIAIGLFISHMKPPANSDGFSYAPDKFYDAFCSLDVTSSEYIISAIFSAIPSNMHCAIENIYHIFYLSFYVSEHLSQTPNL